MAERLRLVPFWAVAAAVLDKAGKLPPSALAAVRLQRRLSLIRQTGQWVLWVLATLVALAITGATQTLRWLRLRVVVELLRARQLAGATVGGVSRAAGHRAVELPQQHQTMAVHKLILI
jgi:hypothetical protein